LSCGKHNEGSTKEETANQPLLPDPEANEPDREGCSGTSGDHPLHQPGTPRREAEGIPDQEDKRAESQTNTDTAEL
jgi:hypothetical protein